ncbi:dihydrodipicolinate synthase family protein [Pseudoprimorskyibacter insulae]|uniref:Putative 5-dehydro-4-deoxyglucarate dehydratase n=1 Tax=Pseudoprimorskyibacter insulae TaxID=1695997 RepID=A0A2R8AVI4_9RHOB|nr:dihydrodipicolinate synthase family protein [Pseudoprimorskyibacter insulae]SPF80041.1 putative 5-dehydro-4-deoxyglucarate dehydratase [Pseudoprimorskyibacter insulae]
MGFELAQSLTGISGILVTPFDAEDQLDTARLTPIVDRAVNAGVHVLTVNGNTGEYYGLTADEAERMAYAVTEIVDGRVPVVGGVGRSINEACALARASAKAGCAGLMVHQPPDPFMSPRGLYDYIARVAEAGQGTPLVLYLRNDAIGTDMIGKICSIEGVAGVKWATPNPMRLSAAIKASPEDVIWVGGLAEVWAPPLYAVGARGFTSGLINVWPERSVAIHAALDAGDYVLADNLIAEMKVFEDIRAEELGGTNVTGVKTALQMMGQDCGPTRPPSAWPLTEDQSTRLRDFLRAADLLKD